MNRLIAWLGVVLLSGFPVSNASANPGFDWVSYLEKEVVQVAGGTYSFKQVEICEMKNPNAKKPSLQFEWSAQAPQSLMSRDNFVAFTASMNTFVLLGFAEGMGIKVSDLDKVMTCRPADSAIGEVDMKIGYAFAAGGLQVSFTDMSTGKVDRSTMSWSQVFH